MSKKYYDRIANEEFNSSIPFTSSIGANLLQKMGWSQGKGLGKNEIGIQQCIQIKKKSDNLGLGAKSNNELSCYWNDWWKDAYNDVANKLSTTINDSRYQDLDTDHLSTDSEDNSNIHLKSIKDKNSKKEKKEKFKEKKTKKKKKKREI